MDFAGIADQIELGTAFSTPLKAGYHVLTVMRSVQAQDGNIQTQPEVIVFKEVDLLAVIAKHEAEIAGLKAVLNQIKTEPPQ